MKPAAKALTTAAPMLDCVLPYTPVASALGLVPLPASFFVFVAVVVASYLGVVEVVKRRVLAWQHKPAHPVHAGRP